MQKYFPRLSGLEWLLILGMSLLYLLVTFYNLTSFPIFVDEAIYGRWSQIALHDAAWRFISLTDGKQPLFMWMTMPMFKLFADPLLAIRSTSVFSGLLTTLGLFYAGYLLKGKRLGYLAMILSIFIPFLFFYNRLAVVDAMLTAFGIWLFSLGLILAKEKRLDLALIVGAVLGLSLLVKSPAKIFLFLLPLGYLTNQDKESWNKSQVLKYLGLFIVIFVVSSAIYSIQRLSPFMYIIEQKNSDFTLPVREILASPTRLWQNTYNTLRWLGFYITWPALLAAALGIFRFFQKSWRTALYTASWLVLPLAAEIAIATLYRSRYIVFVTPIIILFAAYFLDSLKNKLAYILLAVLLILPGFFVVSAVFNPVETPLLSDDADYLDGWSSGMGLREISDYLISEAKTGSQPVYVMTEGTFGLLPHGLELYSYGVSGLAIEGIWPLNEIPPASLLAKKAEGFTVYFLLNNTQVDVTPSGLTEVLSVKKRNDSYIRLYRLN